ncbi:CPBP family intramembrane glutamic endopeptidase [Clostridium sp. ZS2-4]|uniref:CPBP family intramembrane glutamic endopeptidase n=1 Tax=Clostridium sp. ZS2-4 TaxID=2987703 RepID=UPI00227B8AE7|nr:CPBP family intramembrane glutamic endopeptidase [Clostridium sp. ZS2-4]MCY6356248.1 CPBP family intramembrane metalloprotease [Clostridium sp. ZS2-4]
MIIYFFQDKIGFNDDIGFSLALLLSITFFFLLLKTENKEPVNFLNIHKVNFNLIILLIVLAVSGTFFDLGVIELLKKFIETDNSNDIQLYWGSIIHIVFLAPICEEIFFRGIVFVKLKNVMPPFLAVIIQGLIFGCFHGSLLSGHFVQMFSGIMYALIYHYTNNLTISILLHSFDNLVLVILNLLPFTFNINPPIFITIGFLCLLAVILFIKHNNLQCNWKGVQK